MLAAILRAVAREQMGSRPPARLILEIDIRECLLTGVADDVALPDRASDRAPRLTTAPESGDFQA